ncbi:UNVERIFIED_ORG: hypothetical protein J2Y77_000915 [Pseudomonas lini]
MPEHHVYLARAFSPCGFDAVLVGELIAVI